MCGITGYAALDPSRLPDRAAVQAMLAAVAHRGPDDEGVYTAPGVVLGHRRLSIIDVAGGHQPLFGATDQTAIICNGEIYNYRELKRELEARGHRFRTASDTEVAAHAYDAWGLPFLERLDGMFALALWDGARRRLILARDAMGEKPLYWALAGGLLIFGSEMTAVIAHPAVPREIDPLALSEYLALEYVPAPRSILYGVSKLEPGRFLVLENGRVDVKSYWRLDARVPETKMPYPEAVAELRSRLQSAVRSRLVSDVPLGIFLSGGIDSSTIAALAAKEGALETFSIGFDEASFDESSFARQVARHIGSRHHERIVRGSEMPELVPALGRVLDEPLGDASILPTAALSRFAREHVTVALGGDGGDELFAGYPMHQAHRVAHRMRWVPPALHRVVDAAAARLPVSHRNFATGFRIRSFLRGSKSPAPFNHALWMSSFSPAEQRALLAPDVLHAAANADHALDAFENAWVLSQHAPPLARAGHLDAVTYLPNDILMKVDRASMAVALEVRAPFLARTVVDFAFALPDAFRMRGLTGKRILRDAVRDLLPASVLSRPKKGFGMPVAAWLNGPLRSLADEMLDEQRLKQADWFRPETVQRMLRDHREGRADNRKPLWTLLVFELWREQHRLAARADHAAEPIRVTA
jgi:asparagine synthase (glutamine-hydrolysing)